MIKFLVAGALLLSSSLSHAVVYHFGQTNNNNNNLAATPVGDQLTLDVVDGSNGNVNFIITNLVGVPTSITGIYFGDEDTPLFSSINILSQSGGVSFSPGANPPNFPIPTTISFNEVQTADTNGNGNTAITNGIDASTESIIFTASGSNLADTLLAINTGDFKVGLLVKGTAQGGNADDKYINFTSAVPEPEMIWSLSVGLGLLGFAGRRRKA